MATEKSGIKKSAKQEKISKAGKVELNEDQLDEAQGGFSWGESNTTAFKADLREKAIKVTDLGSLSQKVFKT